jgi:hypothetical protein
MDRTFTREAVLDSLLLAEQAERVYNLSIKAFTDGDRKAYDHLQGVAAMLFHLMSGHYRLTVVEEFDNGKMY